MRYLQIGRDTTLPVAVLIHGGLGTASTYIDYFDHPEWLRKVQIISVDRPGHGYSDFGRTETSVLRNAECIYPILEQLRAQKRTIVLIGHSYGATVAARLLMEHPDAADALVLSAPAVDPDHEKRFWFNAPLDHWALKWAMPQNFIIANDEKLAHADECRKMFPFWHKITVPTAYIHGKNDDVVPFVNRDYVQKMLVNAPVHYFTKDDLPHIFVMKKPDVIGEAVENLLNRLKEEKGEKDKFFR
jgi:pimeloyl-ACP methyl ester carboxylesterase